MKKKNIILIILLGVVGLFIPKETFAISIKYFPLIDYRFFVEDKDKNDVEGLKFKIHDINNKISFESNYDSENKTYNFIDVTHAYSSMDDTDDMSNLPKEILPEGFVEELEKIDTDDYYEMSRSISSLIEKYPSIDRYEYSPYFMQVTIPLILEETSGNYEVPIKKVIFAKMLIIPYNNGEYESILYIINNNCSILSQEPIYNDWQKDSFKHQFEIYGEITRKNAYDYSDEVLNKFSGGNFTSQEINSNNYQNRCSNRIASAEIASEEINANLTKEGREETRIADYCECLPLFTQERKEQITINPATWNTGFVVLFLSMIIVTGSSFVLIKKKS